LLRARRLPVALEANSIDAVVGSEWDYGPTKELCGSTAGAKDF